MERNDAVRAIRLALKARSGKMWSVTCGAGTAWGWITIDVPPSREANRPAELLELARLLGLETVHQQGVSIPAGSVHRAEYVDRAQGKVPATVGTPYWD